MKLSILLLTLGFSVPGFGATATSFDSKNECVVYRNTSKEQPVKEGETQIDNTISYGFTMQNMVIDFKKEVVTVELVNRITLGFNRPLVSGPVFIRPSNPNFKTLVNQLNRVLFTFDMVCISSQKELVWATLANP